MHNSLLRRHEKEVQLNVEHMETVTSLTVLTKHSYMYTVTSMEC